MSNHNDCKDLSVFLENKCQLKDEVYFRYLQNSKNDIVSILGGNDNIIRLCLRHIDKKQKYYLNASQINSLKSLLSLHTNININNKLKRIDTKKYFEGMDDITNHDDIYS
eukprot:27796_1